MDIHFYLDGKAKAMIMPEGFSLVPAMDNAKYCLPLAMYLQAVAFDIAGSIACHKSLPDDLSNALTFYHQFR